MTSEEHIVGELIASIQRHERTCGSLAKLGGHNIGEGLSLTREEAELIIAYLRAADLPITTEAIND